MAHLGQTPVSCRLGGSQEEKVSRALGHRVRRAHLLPWQSWLLADPPGVSRQPSAGGAGAGLVLEWLSSGWQAS